MANRILVAVAGVREKLATLSADKQAALKESLNLTTTEFCAFQSAQARAHATGILSLEEAQTVYHALGRETGGADGGWPKTTDLATRVVVTRLVAQLLGIGGGRAA